MEEDQQRYDLQLIMCGGMFKKIISQREALKIVSFMEISSAEAEYRSMASATCEVIWLSNLLGDMGVKDLLPVVLYCDNSSALQIAVNLGPLLSFADSDFGVSANLILDVLPLF
ncbi:ribonuclease H-like domain-containing protein [Tanacetum coccineum]